MKNLRYILVIALFGCLFVPQTGAQAAYTPGTDAYLRQEVGLSDTALSTQVKTEDRQPFPLVTNELSADDPVADVLTRYGTRSGINAGWADITRASMTKNDGNQTWDVLIEVGEPIPESPPQKVQFWILTDSDNIDDNNASGGIRINTDASHMAKYDSENGWATDYRWYNPEADFWALNKETASMFATTDEGNLLYQIPFEELPAEFSPEWRIVAAVEDAGKTQIDVVPGVGFPEAVKQTSETGGDEAGRQEALWWKTVNLSTPHYILLTAFVVAGAYLWYAFQGMRDDAS